MVRQNTSKIRFWADVFWVGKWSVVVVDPTIYYCLTIFEQLKDYNSIILTVSPRY